MRTLTRKQEEPSASVASRPRRTTATAQTDPPGTAPAETAAGSDAGGRPQLVRGPAPHDHVFEMEEAPRMAEPAEEPAQAVAESKAQGQREEFARQPVANRSHRDADSGSGQSGGWGVELEGAHGTLQNDGPSPPTCRVLFVLRTVGPDSAGQAAARAAQREADASIMLPSAAAPAEPPPAAEQ